MTTLIEAARQALDALESIGDEWGFTSKRTVPKRIEAITALRQAIEQAEQAEQAEHYPPECQTEAEKTAYAFGWWKALESVRAEKQEPVAWIGLDLDNMVEAFDRVIEEHHLRKNPFHDPVNRYAMLALRELRGLIAYMKRNTSPPPSQPLTDEKIAELWLDIQVNTPASGVHEDGLKPWRFARAIEAACTKGEA